MSIKRRNKKTGNYITEWEYNSLSYLMQQDYTQESDTSHGFEGYVGASHSYDSHSSHESGSSDSGSSDGGGGGD